MNAPDDLETLLRSLAPNTLPVDLRDRLREEPRCTRPLRVIKRRFLVATGAALAAAAALAFMARDPSAPEAPASGQTVTVLHRDSELVSSRSLGLVEKGGRLFRVEERHWRDEEAALSSGTPVSVRLHADRREIIYQPVRYD